MLNAYWALWKAILSFTEFIHGLAARVQFLVTDVRYRVLIRFPVIVQHSKGAHYFHRVVGLVVLSVSVICARYGPMCLGEKNIR